MQSSCPVSATRPHCGLTDLLTRDAQVFLFCISDKGESWAYASPGFGEALAPAHLRAMRRMGTGASDAAQARWLGLYPTLPQFIIPYPTCTRPGCLGSLPFCIDLQQVRTVEPLIMMAGACFRGWQCKQL